MVALAGALLAGAAVWGFSLWLQTRPTRLVLPPANLIAAVAPVSIAPLPAPLKLVGAWRFEPHAWGYNGWSGLRRRADGQLAVINDDGRAAHFDPATIDQGSIALVVRDLGDGPGPAYRKQNRDSEGLEAAPGGGWFVSFEHRHALWLYTVDFARGRQVADLGALGLGTNRGVEAIVPRPGGGLYLFPEGGGRLVEWDGRRLATRAAPDVPRGASDAIALGDGTYLVSARSLGWGGLANRLVRLDRTMKKMAEWPLRLNRSDNIEGLAIEPRGPGRVRLWMISDDNGRAYARTLLVAADLSLAAT